MNRLTRYPMLCGTSVAVGVPTVQVCYAFFFVRGVQGNVASSVADWAATLFVPCCAVALIIGPILGIACAALLRAYGNGDVQGVLVAHDAVLVWLWLSVFTALAVTLVLILRSRRGLEDCLVALSLFCFNAPLQAALAFVVLSKIAANHLKRAQYDAHAGIARLQ